MTPDINMSIVENTATPAIQESLARASGRGIKRAVGTACVRLLQEHLHSLGPNKRGWPSSGFYAGAARGSGWDVTDEGIEIYCDNEAHPGAMRQRYHGGTIRMKDKMLAIPARQEFAARSPTEFTNLRLAIFSTGTMALVVGKGGVGRVNFATGREQNVSGAGARSESMVAYWLKEEVEQEGDKDVIPTEEQFAQTAIEACAEFMAEGKE